MISSWKKVKGKGYESYFPSCVLQVVSELTAASEQAHWHTHGKYIVVTCIHRKAVLDYTQRMSGLKI